MAETDAAANFDAERMNEEIAAGEQKKPKVDVDADYELSKEFAVADIDKTGAGTAAAEAATENKFELPQPQEIKSNLTESGGDPDSYLEMAKEVNPNL